jgi:hypothetical protein
MALVSSDERPYAFHDEFGILVSKNLNLPKVIVSQILDEL